MSAPRCATEDRDYQAFVDSQAAHCRCSSGNKPCDRVLAGGLCDDIGDSERETIFDDENQID